MQTAVAYQAPLARPITFARPRTKAEIPSVPTLCSTCTLRSVCVPCGMRAEDVPGLDGSADGAPVVVRDDVLAVGARRHVRPEDPPTLA